jgi:energy-coupling factor transporter ATP-binding protein EcfA2
MKNIPINIKSCRIGSIDFGNNDAKFDNIERYFYDLGIINEIEKGNKFIIIGRKGTGKSALAYYYKKICINTGNGDSVQIVSLKDIPINLMEKFADNNFTLTNKFIILWKYIFLVELSKILVNDIELRGTECDKLSAFLDLAQPALKKSPREYLQATYENKFKIGNDNISYSESEQRTEKKIDLLSFIRSGFITSPRLS